MDPQLYIVAGAVLLAVAVVALAVGLVRRSRRARSDEERLAVGPRTDVWVESARSSEVVRTVEEAGPVVEPEPAPSETPQPSIEQPEDFTHVEEAHPSTDLDVGGLHPTSPVELTLGDTRVEVAEGTETHGKLRAYADALLKDLKAARHPSR